MDLNAEDVVNSHLISELPAIALSVAQHFKGAGNMTMRQYVVFEFVFSAFKLTCLIKCTGVWLKSVRIRDESLQRQRNHVNDPNLAEMWRQKYTKADTDIQLCLAMFLCLILF